MKILQKTSALFGAICLATSICGTAHAEDKVLHVYNWVDYIGENTIADFEKEFGIKVVYDTYDSSETVDAKLLAGNSGYDVLIHATSFVPKLLQAGGIFQKIDRKKLTNYGNLDSDILKILDGYDPGNKYAVPYTWGTTGYTYNVDLVNKYLPNAPIGSAELVFNPEYVSKLSECGVSLLDDPTSVIPMALAYLGLDPNSKRKRDYDKVVKLFKPIRPYIKTFDSSNYLNSLPTSDRCVAMTWSADYAVAAGRAEEAGVQVNLNYFMPKEGAVIWFDSWLIPSDAPHPDNAHKWLNYMLRPEVIAGVTNYTWYANANREAASFVSKEILDDPASYPSDELVKSMFSIKAQSQKVERIRTRTWTRIKTGQ